MHPPGDGWPSHTACRENVPNSTQNERYVCIHNEYRMGFFYSFFGNYIPVLVLPFTLVFLCVVVLLSVFSPDRTENADGQEFLSGTGDKKTTRFTDVRANTAPVCFHAFWVCNLFPVCIIYSLRAKPHLACLSSTWATPSWAVGSWDWHTPWPIQGSSSFCEFLIFLDSLLPACADVSVDKACKNKISLSSMARDNVC